ncbi:MAG: helix-turn-helix transcriptional regulator [Lachnospiraceae bacterium]|nr:helix-turn-helix transcriptional regulator [Lachnospiraceae bacterium]
MILADKIINERKRCGWSQEELAEKLSVSRQSVSKWEGAQAVPDLQKILKMAEIFNVTTDYLLRDEIEGVPVDNTGYTEDKDYNIRKVSMEEANEYLDTIKALAPKLALGVLLCVVSPILLIVLAGISESGLIPENVAVAIGLGALFGCIAVAVFLFVAYGMKTEKYEFLTKEDFETEYGVDGMVKDKKAKTEEFYGKMIVAAVLLCVLCPVPLVMVAVMGASSMMVISMVGLLLAMVAMATYIFVLIGSITDSYKILLKEKEFSKEHKKGDKIVGSVAGTYWLIVTAIFLYLGFVHDSWKSNWIIWPIAGLVFAAIMTILNAIVKRDE